jgi:pyridinium-3,5-biscarboxylic acid mononucleotide sulfurtransferase
MTGKNKKTTPGRIDALHAGLRAFDRVLVAFSGGVDSTFLLAEAADLLGRRNVVAATILSDTATAAEKERAVGLCRSFGVRHEMIEIDVVSKPAFRRNDPERCYHCKKVLFRRLLEKARELRLDAVLEATHADDSADYRPGRRALAELGVESPLLRAGFGKKEIRRLSRQRGLATASLPSAACLASRVPYGTPITADLLKAIEKGEEAIRRLGFRQFRLRHHGDVARLEFAPAELERAFRFRRSLHRRIVAAGWPYVAIDLIGYRTGSLNETLDDETLRRGD